MVGIFGQIGGQDWSVGEVLQGFHSDQKSSKMVVGRVMPSSLAWGEQSPARCVTTCGPPHAKKARLLSSKFEITTMFKACQAGDLGLCRQLWNQGPEETRRLWPAMTIKGWNLMAVASSEGRLDIVKWLAAVGAPEANWLVETGAGRDGGALLFHPVYVASYNGHLHVAKWLFSTGAAKQLWGSCAARNYLLGAACTRGSLDVTVWLLSKGAGNEDHEHVDVDSLGEAFIEDKTGRLAQAARRSLKKALRFMLLFSAVVLPAVRFTPSSPLHFLRGHEATLLLLVADFAGVVRGRELRNTREAWMVLHDSRAYRTMLGALFEKERVVTA